MAHTNHGGQDRNNNNDSRQSGKPAGDERKNVHQHQATEKSDTSFPKNRKKDHRPKDPDFHTISDDDEDLGRHVRDTQRANTMDGSSSRNKKS